MEGVRLYRTHNGRARGLHKRPPWANGAATMMYTDQTSKQARKRISLQDPFVEYGHEIGFVHVDYTKADMLQHLKVIITNWIMNRCLTSA